MQTNKGTVLLLGKIRTGKCFYGEKAGMLKMYCALLQIRNERQDQNRHAVFRAQIGSHKHNAIMTIMAA